MKLPVIPPAARVQKRYSAADAPALPGQAFPGPYSPGYENGFTFQECPQLINFIDICGRQRFHHRATISENLNQTFALAAVSLLSLGYG
jgi:hypothetical protein